MDEYEWVCVIVCECCDVSFHYFITLKYTLYIIFHCCVDYFYSGRFAQLLLHRQVNVCSFEGSVELVAKDTSSYTLISLCRVHFY